MKAGIKILDCTLRDGGLGLEDAHKNSISNLTFDQTKINEIIRHLSLSNLNIIELGSIEITKDDKKCYAIYQNIEEISKLIPKNINQDQMYAALFRGPDTPIDDIPKWNSQYCEGIRVIIRYSELKKSLDFCAALAEKGYKVFVQPMLTMRYSAKEIQMVIDYANGMDAYALYFVDSYGYMQEKNIIDFFNTYDKGLKSSIKIGFHAHNNMNLAFPNALTFIDNDSSRNIILDSCILGMGQGAGNLQTEIIADYMNKHYDTHYEYNNILELCDIIESYCPENLWGYSVTRLLPAIHKTAYKFAVVLRHKYKLSYVDINNILNNMPENMRNRYTPEDAEKIVNIYRSISTK